MGYNSSLGGRSLLPVWRLFSGALIGALLLPATSGTQPVPHQPEPQQPVFPKAWQGMGASQVVLGLPPVYDEQKRPITAGGFVDSGPKAFEDITKAAGLSGWNHKMGNPKKQFIVEANGSGVGLIDYDNDGWLDIFLVNGSTFDALDGKEEPPHAALFHNDHDGTFTDMAVKAGVTNDRWGYGVSIADYDNDGWPDIYVSNYGNNRLYHNNHDGTFTDVAEKAGVALGNWSTGSAWGDYDGDDFKVLYRNEGDASFSDVSYETGVAQITVPFVGWGDGFIDYDNDGWLDLFMVNGHVYSEADQHDWGTSFAERPLLFHKAPNGKERRFEYVPPVKGSGLAVVIPARGAAFGDLFNDGKIDVVINPIDGPPVLLRNVNPDRHHWVELNLVGGPKSPRDATCATVYLNANGMRMRQDVLASGSYISSNDRRPHFGLGDSTEAGTAEIHWPSGAREIVKLPAVDRKYTIAEGSGITGVLCGGKPCAVAPLAPAASSIKTSKH